MLKKYLTGFNKVIQIKEKMAYETKCQILIVQKKLRLCNKKLNMRKQKIREETPKTYIDSKEIHVFRFFI